ncbi:MAG: hypothetical protein ACD_79C01443G0001 [uncultured bacterium]|nr:MAG: hypothetical protein ACD_79C01443G0001 [uncultured bacterium]
MVPVRDHKISIFDLHKKYHTKPARKVTVEEMNHAINEGWVESGKKSL